ncbi:MAG: hypothetical protein OEY44_02865, partial [Candidatus Peregrinibacteria bacterium]|nr:hypothetical protein [Candidatus Peregrinibacteria bacterium]
DGDHDINVSVVGLNGPDVDTANTTITVSVGSADAGVDGGVDGGVDAGADGGAPDAGADAGSDGGVDAAVDAPTISNLAIDCSSTANTCIGGGNFTYPVSFTIESSGNCAATVENLSNVGTNGSVSDVSITGNIATLDFTPGSVRGDEFRITITCINADKSTSDYIDVMTY